jgi:hypothetical protein
MFVGKVINSHPKDLILPIYDEIEYICYSHIQEHLFSEGSFSG